MKISTRGKWIGAAVSVAGGFVLLSGFEAGAAGMHRGFDPAKMAKFVTFKVNDTLDDLNATDTQRTKVLAIKDQMLADFQASMPQHKVTRQALLAQWNSDKPDQKAVYDAIDADIENMRAAAHKAADNMMQVHAVLTPEQRTQLAEKFHHGGPMGGFMRE